MKKLLLLILIAVTHSTPIFAIGPAQNLCSSRTNLALCTMAGPNTLDQRTGFDCYWANGTCNWVGTGKYRKYNESEEVTTTESCTINLPSGLNFLDYTTSGGKTNDCGWVAACDFGSYYISTSNKFLGLCQQCGKNQYTNMEARVEYGQPTDEDGNIDTTQSPVYTVISNPSCESCPTGSHDTNNHTGCEADKGYTCKDYSFGINNLTQYSCEPITTTIQLYPNIGISGTLEYTYATNTTNPDSFSIPNTMITSDQYLAGYEICPNNGSGCTTIINNDGTINTTNLKNAIGYTDNIPSSITASAKYVNCTGGETTATNINAKHLGYNNTSNPGAASQCSFSAMCNSGYTLTSVVESGNAGCQKCGDGKFVAMRPIINCTYISQLGAYRCFFDENVSDDAKCQTCEGGTVNATGDRCNCNLGYGNLSSTSYNCRRVIPYTIQLTDPDGGNTEQTLTYRYAEDTITSNNPTIPSRNNYVFDGYYLNNKQIVSANGTINKKNLRAAMEGLYTANGNILDETLTAKAKWTLMTYNIEYKYNSTSFTHSNIGYNTNPTLKHITDVLPSPTVVFLGWKCTSNCPTTCTNIIKQTDIDNKSCQPATKTHGATITYTAQTTTCTNGTITSKYTTCTCNKGYSGWSTSTGKCNPTVYTNIIIQITKDTSYTTSYTYDTALSINIDKFNRKKYQLTGIYTAETNGTLVAEVKDNSVEFNDAFKNWIVDTTPENRKLYARYTPKTYTVIYNNGDACEDTATYYTEYKIQSTTPTTNACTSFTYPGPIRSGEEFVGWKSDKHGEKIFATGTILNELDPEYSTGQVNLYPAYADCSAGYYCTSAKKEPCPYGSTSDAGAKQIQQCYLSLSDTGTRIKDTISPAEFLNKLMTNSTKIYYK